MPVNSRAKGANFEREIANLLIDDLNLTNPVKRILEQTRTKELPDLQLGRLCIECKRYGDGAEPLNDWWDQVITSAGDNFIPILVYKFNRRPIKVKMRANSLNSAIKDEALTVEMIWPDFISIVKTLFQEDINLHESY